MSEAQAAILRGALRGDRRAPRPDLPRERAQVLMHGLRTRIGRLIEPAAGDNADQS